ncbi:hypothetical protein HYPSUDRAFT_195593 [Hypholoma sublateritium FD-334 SS-4]|uniref:Restriction of telomere capping protein 4 n=1 Tax=Hypholoma sublateritium (strain FD-334 SS-4) TaxID=945553 RepID=A0A0D2NZ79_HYPSF|nr:hypothetical protein HYPSUDRAFT_195593 [Hypholoma sublateritium FD-334 SS-4]
MEGRKNDKTWSGRNADDDPEERLPNRPGRVPPIAFYDYGSSLGPPRKQTTGTVTKERNHGQSQTASKSSAAPTKRPAHKASTRKSVLHFSDDDDQLDCLSSQPDDDPSSRQSPIRRKYGKAPAASSDSDEVIEVLSLESKAISTSNAIKKIKFNKIKDAAPSVPIYEVEDDSFNISTPKPRVSDSNIGGYRRAEERRPLPLENPRRSHDSSTRVRDRYDRVDSRPLTERNVKPNRPVSPPRRRNDNPNILPRKARPQDTRINESKSSQTKVIPNSYRNSEVRSSKSILDMVDRTAVKAGSSKITASSSLTRARSRSKSRSRYSSGESSPERRTKKKMKAPDPFPIFSPTSSPVSIERTASSFPQMSPLAGSKVSPPIQNSAKLKKALPSRAPAEFPTLSPTKYDVPDDPPKSRKDKGKGKAPNKENDEDKHDEDWVRKKKVKASVRQKKPEEFPMNTQMLKSLDSTSPLRPRKRLSEDGSEGEHTPKKSRKNHESRPESPARHAFEDEGDSLCIAPHVDPKTLCPYCDSPLPTSPSPLLLKILAETKKKATRDPRPSNPLGLRAPLTAFIAACQRHRFESQILPEAEQKGWPKSIDWKGISGRILKMRQLLKALIEDLGHGTGGGGELDPDGWEVLFENKSDSKQGAKARSVFWKEIMEEVRQKGLRAVSGVRGQFANFEKAQPGYYGEIGSVIIHQTLYNMFPLAEMNPEHVAPLTTNEFVQRILVPEVALHLIMEDKRLKGDDGTKAALAILRDSSAYGVAMFPEDGGEWDTGRKKQQEDKIGVGDMIVMERARKRRIELEEEDKHEEAQRWESEAATRKSRKKEERTKARRRAKEEEMALASSDTNIITGSQQPPRPRPRPRTTVMGSSSSAIGVPLSSLENTEETTMRARSRSRSVRNAVATDVSSDTDDVYVTDRHRASSMERRRSPSASETRNVQREEGMPSKAARSRMASLKLDSDSESSTRAEVGRGKRAPSRARSVARDAVKRSSSVIELDSDDDEIEIVDVSLKTPKLKRRTAKAMDTDDEDQATPKPAVQISSLLPLERSRLKKKQAEKAAAQTLAARQKPVAPGKPRASSPNGTSDAPIEVPTDSDRSRERGKSKLNKNDSATNHAWLLSNPSSPSQGSKKTFHGK